MPLYEYICPNCRESFEKLANIEQDVACPACGRQAKKKVSVFAASTCASPAGSGFG
jgi:putative FmdB family regulatory protein